MSAITIPPSGQYIEALLRLGLITEIDPFLESLSFVVTYQDALFNEQNGTSSLFGPNKAQPMTFLTFDELIDPTLLTPDAPHVKLGTSHTIYYFKSATVLYETLCKILITAFTEQQKSGDLNLKRDQLSPIFSTKIWFDISIQLLIHLTQAVQFKSFLLLNTHEATGLDSVHIFDSHLNQRKHWKLQTSTKFITPQILHLYQLITTFLENLVVQLPLYWYAFMSAPYDLVILSPLWSLPVQMAKKHDTDDDDDDDDDNDQLILISHNLSLNQYQQYVFTTLLSQPAFLHNPELATFLNTQLNIGNTTVVDTATSTPNQPIAVTTDQPHSSPKLPLYAIIILILLPLAIYSSPELLAIQSLRQAYLYGSPEHRMILDTIQFQTNRTAAAAAVPTSEPNNQPEPFPESNNGTTTTTHEPIYTTIPINTTLGRNDQSDNQETLLTRTPQLPSSILKSPDVPKLHSLIPCENNDGKARFGVTYHKSVHYPSQTNLSQEQLDIFLEQSEISKLSLFYTNNSDLTRLLGDIYQLDLDQQERYYTICTQRTRIDGDLHHLLSRIIMLVYNYVLFQVQLDYQVVKTPELATYSLHEERLVQTHDIPNFSKNRGNFAAQLLRMNGVELTQNYDPISYSTLLSMLPTLIALGHHQQYIVGRPLKRLLFLLNAALESEIILDDITFIINNNNNNNNNNNTQNIENHNNPFSEQNFKIKTIIINTLSAIDFISTKLTSPTPITQLPATNIESTLEQYTTISTLHSDQTTTPTMSQTLTKHWSESSASPLLLPTIISRDFLADSFESFTHNPLFQYPILIPFQVALNPTTANSISTSKKPHFDQNAMNLMSSTVEITTEFLQTISATGKLFYFDFCLHRSTKQRTDHSAAVIHSTQLAQDVVYGYYATPSFNRAFTPQINNSVGLTTDVGNSGDDVFDYKNLGTHQKWKDLDHCSFVLFLYRFGLQAIQKSPVQPTTYQPNAVSPPSPKVFQIQSCQPSQIESNCSDNPMIPVMINPIISQLDAISTSSATNQSTFTTPQVKTGGGPQLPNLLSLGVNDFRFLIDMLLNKLSQQPLYLTQLSYPISQHCPFIVVDQFNTHISQLEPFKTVLSWDLLTVLQLTTNINLTPSCLQYRRSEQQQQQQQQQFLHPPPPPPSLFLLLSLLQSSDPSQLYTPFMDLSDSATNPAQLTQFPPHMPPSYHLTMLIVLIRLVLIWKEWDSYRSDDVFEVLTNTIEMLRNQKLQLAELIEERYGITYDSAAPPHQPGLEHIKWSRLDESLLDVLFALLGQLVIKMDEKMNQF